MPATVAVAAAALVAAAGGGCGVFLIHLVQLVLREYSHAEQLGCCLCHGCARVGVHHPLELTCAGIKHNIVSRLALLHACGFAGSARPVLISWWVCPVQLDRLHEEYVGERGLGRLVGFPEGDYVVVVPHLCIQ